MIKLMVIGCFLTGCWGNTSVDNALIGQVKGVHNETPRDLQGARGIYLRALGALPWSEHVLTCNC